MAQTPAPKAIRRCPICKSETVHAYQPFCSKRCADIDLGKWFNNSYAIPGAPDDDEAEKLIESGGDEDDRAS